MERMRQTKTAEPSAAWVALAAGMATVNAALGELDAAIGAVTEQRARVEKALAELDAMIGEAQRARAKIAATQHRGALLLAARDSGKHGAQRGVRL